MGSGMDEAEQLHRAAKWQTGKKADKAAKLGEVAERLLKERISPQQRKCGPVIEAWGRLLPAALQSHCRVVEVSGGQLKVLADSSSYAYELQLCSSELIEQLQQQCPRAQIRKIKITAG
jgi:predicted nucleic acid-binding Zn ribbon protein